MAVFDRNYFKVGKPVRITFNQESFYGLVNGIGEVTLYVVIVDGSKAAINLQDVIDGSVTIERMVVECQNMN